MRVKHLPRNRHTRSYVFKPYASGADYLAEFGEAMVHPRVLCSAGLFPVIENIELTNQNLSHYNSFRWYNLFGGMKLVTTLKQDGLRGDRYEVDAERYIAFQREKIEQYVANCNSAVEVRLGSYVDPCYVDAGYVSPNSDPVPA
mgnify:CR=1 FL=1